MCDDDAVQTVLTVNSIYICDKFAGEIAIENMNDVLF